MTPDMAALSVAPADFVAHEAQSARRAAATTNGSRCSPTTAATGCRCRRRAGEAAAHNALADEDLLLLQLRVERLKDPRAHSQHPPSRCQHVLQPPRSSRCDDGAQAAVLRTPFIYCRVARRAADHARRQLPPPPGRTVGSAWRIRLKRVDLLRRRQRAADDPALSLTPPFHHQELTTMKTSPFAACRATARRAGLQRRRAWPPT